MTANKKKKIGIFGSTGSIGTQSLEIIDKHKDILEASVLTCGRNLKLFRQQLEAHEPKIAVIQDEMADEAADLRRDFPNTQFFYGNEGLVSAASSDEYDIMLNALLGIAGMAPTYAAICQGHEIALANKETLVAGGEVITAAARKHNVRIHPVDSEHSAIFQCLTGSNGNPVKRIILTASGGPFRGYTKKQLAGVTLAQALKHPRWEMGAKITIDSATLMNKGLEVIEAKWLFDLKPEQIQVVVHPESIVHSMVEFQDNAVMAQLGTPDMKIPISYALSYPERWETDAGAVDFAQIGMLKFENVNMETFTCLKLAWDALKEGGSCPVVLNAANEVLVQMFLEEKIRFIEIQEYLERILNSHKPAYEADIESVLDIDRETRIITRKLANGQRI